MNTYRMIVTVASVLLCLTIQSNAATTAVNTSTAGGFTILDSIEVDDGRGTISSSMMTNVTVIQFNNGGANNSNLIQPGGTGALPAPRQSVLEDFALNNGIINPGAGSGLSTGDQLVGNEVGLGLRFNSAVKNVNGLDAVFFELTVGSGQDPDSVSIALLDSTNTVIGNEVAFTSGDYGFKTDQLNSQVISLTPPVNSLAGLNTNVVANGGVVDSFYNLLELEFSDFGLASGDSVHGLFIRGANIDPTLVAGLPGPSVPEPTTAALGLMGIAGLVLRRRKVA